MMRWVAYGSGALLTAACGDALVEALQNLGAFGASAIDRNHQGVLPVLALAACALVAFGAALVRRRFASRDGDWLVALARDVGRGTPRAHLAAIVTCALAVVCAIEAYERGFGGGMPFGGGNASLEQILASLAIYVVCAAVVARALGGFMHGVVATCDALARVAREVIAWLDRATTPTITFCRYSARSIVARPSVLLRSASGDRSPPPRFALDTIS